MSIPETYGPIIWPILNAVVIIATEILTFPMNLFFPSTKINATDPGTPKPYSKQARKKQLTLFKSKNATPRETVEQENNNNKSVLIFLDNQFQTKTEGMANNPTIIHDIYW